jgi:hypothetical protein
MQVAYLDLLDFITDATVDLLTNNLKSWGWFFWFFSFEKKISYCRTTRFYMKCSKIERVQRMCSLLYKVKSDFSIKIVFVLKIHRVRGRVLSSWLFHDGITNYHSLTRLIIMAATWFVVVVWLWHRYTTISTCMFAYHLGSLLVLFRQYP